MDPSSLFAAVKEAALPGVWAQGVKLARSGKVSLENSSDDEATFRVKAPTRPIAPTVILYLADDEWACDCGGRNDPCEHVVAAAIAAKQAKAEGQPLPKSEDVRPQLGYRFDRRPGPAVTVRRVVVDAAGQETPLRGSLTTLLAEQACPVEPTHDDLKADRILSHAERTNPRRGATGAEALSPGALEALLRTLVGNKNVLLEGKPIEVEADPLLPRGVVRDDGEHVVLRVEASKDLGEVLDRGLALSRGKLRPLGAIDLTGPRLERLPLERRVEAHDIGELVAKILPELEKQITVDIESRRLPKRGGMETPRIAFDLTPKGHTLSILPTLVYGDPPRARIDGDKLVHLEGEVPRRNPAAERDVVGRLRDELNLVPGRVVHFDGHEAARFAQKLRDFQETSAASFQQELVSKKPLVPRVVVEGNAFAISFVEEGEEVEREASLEAVFRSWRAGLDLAPLEDGGWAPLPSDWLNRYGERVADLLAARRGDGTIPAFASPRLAALCDDLGQTPPPAFDRLRPLIENFDQLPEAELPRALTATLRPYQREGVDWLTFLRDAHLGAVLADDMGLGKTLQTLCAVTGKTLVVCPRSVVFNWAREIEKFRPDLRCNIFHGPRRALDDADVTITTYAVLRLDIEQLVAHGFDVIVLDEAQAIKNPESQSARAAFALAEAQGDEGFRVALSGTPIENRLDELWSVFHFTHPGLLGSRSDFDARYARPISATARAASRSEAPGAADSPASSGPVTRTTAEMDADGETTASRLRQLIKPFLLRRLKRDVATDLPPRTDVVMTVELEDNERELYNAIYAAKQKEVIEALQQGSSVMAALEALLRLRQAACHPSLVPGQQAKSSSKVEALLDALDDAAADGHRAIVFSQWTSLLDLIQVALEEHEIRFTRLDGTTRDRGAVVEEFQSEDGPPVLLSSLKAGGAGLNLTAADHVFLMDPWWNPAAEDQAADRAHRIGQERPVTVYRLIAKDTIEEGILKLQEQKRGIQAAALEEGGAAAGVTREDLLGLLSL